MKVKVQARKIIEITDEEWLAIEEQGIMFYFPSNATMFFSENTEWEIINLPIIIKDDEHCFGKPRIEGTGISVEMIVDRFIAGDSIELLTDDYNLSKFQVEEWILLCVMVPGTDHEYKNDRAAIESFRRYFRMGVFPGFIYERGLVKRNPKFKRCERHPCVKEGTIWIISNEGDGAFRRRFCPDCIRVIRKVCPSGDYTETEESRKVK